jgi:HD-GYP domain-containing protein (c-di-GMP phosphodiesterase class II)
MLNTASQIKTGSCLICPGTKTPLCSDCSVPLHQLAQSLGNAVDAKDGTTYNHSEDVAAASELMAILAGLPEREVEKIHLAAHLHDIGKIGIPDSILKKPGRLNQEEQLEIQKHPEIGARIIEPVLSFSDPSGVADIILHHHERYDGGGYPHGLSGSEIPLGARIIAIADTLSAMLQNRHYRAGTSFEMAVAEIIRCSGSQFDPYFVSIFIRNTGLLKTVFTLKKQGPRFEPADINLGAGTRDISSSYMLNHAF